MPVAAIYARKSNKETHATREVLSTTRQIEQARAYAARKGWAVDERHIYRDEAITGAQFVKRQQFTRLLAAVYERGLARTRALQPPHGLHAVCDLRPSSHDQEAPRSGRGAYKCSWNNERGQAGCANGASVPVQAAEDAVLNTLLGDVRDRR